MLFSRLLFAKNGSVNSMQSLARVDVSGSLRSTSGIDEGASAGANNLCVEKSS